VTSLASLPEKAFAAGKPLMLIMACRPYLGRAGDSTASARGRTHIRVTS
jgi:hypothetical protein